MDTTATSNHETTDNKTNALKGALLLKAMQRLPYACLVVPGPGGRIRTKIEFLAGCGTVNEYAYDADGRLTQVKRDGRVTEQYAYDEQGRRAMDWGPLRGVDKRGHEYGPDNQLLRAGEITFEYDAMGRLLRRKEPGKQDFICMYTPLGFLGAARLPDMHWVSYDRDGDGRRTAKQIDRKKVEGYGWDKQGRLKWFFDDLARETSWFQYEDSEARLPEFMQRAGATYRLAWDHLGSLRAVIDSQGKVLKEIEYDAFGNILRETAPELRIPFGFAGGLHDRDTGLIRYRFREYLPDTGRFTAKDPIGYHGGDADLYGYCLDDPVNGIDPDGLQARNAEENEAPRVFVADQWENRDARADSGHTQDLDLTSQPNVSLLPGNAMNRAAQEQPQPQSDGVSQFMGADQGQEATGAERQASGTPGQASPAGEQVATDPAAPEGSPHGEAQIQPAITASSPGGISDEFASNSGQGIIIRGYTREDFARNPELAGILGLEGKELKAALSGQTEQRSPSREYPEMEKDRRLVEAMNMPDDRWVRRILRVEKDTSRGPVNLHNSDLDYPPELLQALQADQPPAKQSEDMLKSATEPEPNSKFMNPESFILENPLEEMMQLPHYPLFAQVSSVPRGERTLSATIDTISGNQEQDQRQRGEEEVGNAIIASPWEHVLMPGLIPLDRAAGEVAASIGINALDGGDGYSVPYDDPQVLTFNDWVESLPDVRREWNESFVHYKVADSYEELPPELFHYFPPGDMQALISRMGNHTFNIRLGNGYHLTYEGQNSKHQGWYVHYDAFDPAGHGASLTPLTGFLKHYMTEVGERENIWIEEDSETWREHSK